MSCPARAGKKVLCCAAETFEYITAEFDDLLDELAVLASHRQRARGIRVTRWKLRWRTQISIRLALAGAAALLKGALLR